MIDSQDYLTTARPFYLGPLSGEKDYMHLKG